MQPSRNLRVAEVKFTERGGSIHAQSDEIPGLHIIGTDRESVMKDVINGIKFVFQHIHGKVVDVEWVDTPASVLPHAHTPRDIARFAVKPTFDLAHA